MDMSRMDISDRRDNPWLDRLLRCYPPPFRARFERGMRAAFERDLDAARARGRAAVLAFWIQSWFDALRFGLIERRRGHGGLSMSSLFAVDVRDALRSLRASPVVTLVAVVSLALGIGANTALFSILDSMVLKPLPVRAPASLVVLDDGSWTNPIWEQIRDRRHEIFADAFAWGNDRFNLAAHGETDFVDGTWASGSLFDVLGVKAALGRTFTAADDVRGGGADGPVAVVSYGFWQRRLGGTPDAVGRHLQVNGFDVTIVGVMPRGFLGPDVGRSADIILPIGAVAVQPGLARQLDGRSTWWLEIMGRLKPGQSPDQAAARLNALRSQIREATLPQDWPAKELAGYLSDPLKLVPAANGQSELRRAYVKPLQIVLGLVGAVLAIACANLANLLLARAAARRHEMSVRLALGASRFRLVKQLLAEAALLAAAGASVGLIVSRWGSALLVRQLATDARGVALDLTPDWRVLFFTASVAALTAVVFGTAPAFGVGAVSANDAIKAQTRTVTGERRFGLRNLLVAVQVALSLALVVGGLLFVRTLAALSSVSLGFQPDGLMTIVVNTRPERLTRAEQLQLYDRLRDAVAASPGVAGAAVSVLTPVGTARWNTVVEPTPLTAALTDRQRLSNVNIVSPGWFDTFGMHVLAGRDFDRRDAAGGPRVMIVNESFVRRFFGDPQGVIGKEIRTSLEGPNISGYRLVGIVNDTVYSGLRKGFEPMVFVPLAQLEHVPAGVVVTARAARGDGEILTRELSAVVSQTDAQVSFTIRPLSAQLSAAVRQERLTAILAGFFGSLALLLAAVGLYGVAAHSVAQRRAEIGIRMALGADPRGVVRLVLGRLVGLLAVGVALGVAVSWWTVQLFDKLLFGLQPRDPASFALALALLFAAGLGAGWLPARRAARIDPVQTLREA
jgi:putative ABC transport system permease protein